jgi:cysteine desulfurase/selenocysteine lyase
MSAHPAPLATAGLDLEAIRRDFPILHQKVNGKPLVYLDNAASSQRPQAVIDAISRYYEHDHANVHRGVHTLSQRATDAFEGARDVVRRFINARDTKEIIFVRGTTEAVNLVAQSFARPKVGAGDEILISGLEHHANIVPWQLLCEQTGATLKVVPITATGEVDFAAFEKLIGPRTRLLALAHVSNALGTIVPVEKFIAVARRHGVPVLLDGAQAIPHGKVDVRALDCDFYCFSSHKMLGPTGIGILYGRQQLLEAMPPWQGGGDMILSVSFGLTIVGTAPRKAAVVSFVMAGIHPHDIGTILDTEGVAIRTGHHCAMPVMEFFKVPATARASMSFYNTFEEIDRLVAALEHTREVLG